MDETRGHTQLLVYQFVCVYIRFFKIRIRINKLRGKRMMETKRYL